MNRQILLLLLALPALFLTAIAAADNPTSFTMPLGVDDAGRPQIISRDPSAQAAYAFIGFKFLVYHYWGRRPLEEIDGLDAWAEVWFDGCNGTA